MVGFSTVPVTRRKKRGIHPTFPWKGEVYPSTTASKSYPQRTLVLPSEEVRANEIVQKPQRDSAPQGADI